MKTLGVGLGAVQGWAGFPSPLQQRYPTVALGANVKGREPSARGGARPFGRLTARKHPHLQLV